MNWERKALETVIGSLIEQDIKWTVLFNQLADLGVSLDFDSPAYEALKELTEWDVLAENIEGYAEDDGVTKEMLVNWCMEQVEANYTKE